MCQQLCIKDNVSLNKINHAGNFYDIVHTDIVLELFNSAALCQNQCGDTPAGNGTGCSGDFMIIGGYDLYLLCLRLGAIYT